MLQTIGDKSLKKQVGRCHGFTILEVMMAVVVMSFVISAAILSVQMGFKALDTARNTTIAAQIIQSEMESLRLQNWSTIGSLPASQSVDISSVFGDVSRPGNNFTCTLGAAAVSGAANLMQLTVTVGWNGYDGRSHTLSSSTYYGKDGLYDYLYTNH